MSTIPHTHSHGEGGHAGADHDHAREHRLRRAASQKGERAADRRRLFVALLLTTVIAAAEGIGGYLTNYLALMADAGHMVTDISALGLSMLALWFAERPANVKKTYGYFRLEILSALLNGFLLLGITAVIVYEAYERLRAPAAIDLKYGLLIAAVGLMANVGALWFLHRSASMNVRAAFLHVLGDTLSSVGVIAAAAVMAFTGWLVLDPIIAIAISLVIVFGAYRLVRDAVDVLLEAVPAHVDLDAVRELMAKVEGVTQVHDLHVWTISSGIYALSAHLVVLDPMVCNNDAILSAVKHELFDRFGIDHTTIQIESETYAHLGEVH